MLLLSLLPKCFQNSDEYLLEYNGDFPLIPDSKSRWRTTHILGLANFSWKQGPEWLFLMCGKMTAFISRSSSPLSLLASVPVLALPQVSQVLEDTCRRRLPQRSGRSEFGDFKMPSHLGRSPNGTGKATKTGYGRVSCKWPDLLQT